MPWYRVRMVRIGLVGDRNESVIAHRAIDIALRMFEDVEAVWLHTSSIPDLESFDGPWCCVPRESFRFARERGRPFPGTCGGFQHAILSMPATYSDCPKRTMRRTIRSRQCQ